MRQENMHVREFVFILRHAIGIITLVIFILRLIENIASDTCPIIIFCHDEIALCP